MSTLTIAQIVAWVQAGLQVAEDAGLHVGHADEIVDTVVRGFNQARTALAAADRETLDAAAIAAFKAKGVAAVLQNDVLQREFGGGDSGSPVAPTG